MKTFPTMCVRRRFGSALPALLVGALGLAGCDDHYTTQEAYAACRELGVQEAEADDPDAFNACVACHENCGDECKPAASNNPSFACPDDEGGGGGGGGGGGD